MANAGSSYLQIHNVLTELITSEGSNVTWTMEDLRNIFPRDPLRDPYDAHRVLELLMSRFLKEGLFYDYKEDDSGKLDLIFTELNGAKECWQKRSNVWSVSLCPFDIFRQHSLVPFSSVNIRSSFPESSSL